MLPGARVTHRTTQPGWTFWVWWAWLDMPAKMLRCNTYSKPLPLEVIELTIGFQCSKS
jgi:hypothetical protein